VEGKPPGPFKYIDKGAMAQIGRGAAVIELPASQTMTGQLAWVQPWLGVHLALLNGAEQISGYKNRKLPWAQSPRLPNNVG
jgi:NADH dehydrogenase